MRFSRSTPTTVVRGHCRSDGMAQGAHPIDKWTIGRPVLPLPHEISPIESHGTTQDIRCCRQEGGRRNAPRLLKLPQKSQLRTGSCDQVSRICSSNGRHGRLVNAAAIDNGSPQRQGRSSAATVDGCGRQRWQLTATADGG